MGIVRVEAGKLFETVALRLEQVDLLLDIGCGIRPQQLVRPMTHICCEPCSQYVAHLQAAVAASFDRSYLIVNAGWREAVLLFPAGSVDTVFLVDVIEHLDKEEARELLQATVRLARRQIAVFTPLGFIPQSHRDGKDAWGLDGGAWQEHKSGWSPEDFDDGWEIFLADPFHLADNMGNPLAEPFGAFWAIMTKPDTAQQKTPPGRKAIRAIHDIAAASGNLSELLNTHQVVAMSARDFSPVVTQRLLVVLRLGLKIKRSWFFGKIYRLFSRLKFISE